MGSATSVTTNDLKSKLDSNTLYLSNEEEVPSFFKPHFLIKE